MIELLLTGPPPTNRIVAQENGFLFFVKKNHLSSTLNYIRLFKYYSTNLHTENRI